MTFYAEMAQTAEMLLREFGKPCEVILEHASRYDVETGQITAERVIVPVSAYFNHRYFDFPQNTRAELAKEGDILVYLSAAPLLHETNLLGSILQDGDTQWRIITCQPLKPAQTVLYYQVQARLT